MLPDIYKRLSNPKPAIFSKDYSEIFASDIQDYLTICLVGIAEQEYVEHDISHCLHYILTKGDTTPGAVYQLPLEAKFQVVRKFPLRDDGVEEFEVQNRRVPIFQIALYKAVIVEQKSVWYSRVVVSGMFQESLQRRLDFAMQVSLKDREKTKKSHDLGLTIYKLLEENYGSDYAGIKACLAYALFNVDFLRDEVHKGIKPTDDEWR